MAHRFEPAIGEANHVTSGYRLPCQAARKSEMTGLMKLSSLKVGVDVPWVTSWTAEPVLGVARCVSVGGRLALTQSEAAGFGKPEYSKNHLLRQRLSVSRMLCPMCGKPTSAEDRVTQVARRRTAGAMRANGAGRGLPSDVADDRILIDAGSIAPLHGRCSDLSLQHCPHLRSLPDIDVQPFPGRWIILPLMIEAREPEPAGRALLRAPTAPVVHHVVAFLQLCGLPDTES